MFDRMLWTAGSAIAVLLVASPAVAADVQAEITIAGQHADYAAASSDLAGVRMHLHHTLNCLEGPKGADFDAKEMNPCANAGNGAIPDSTNPTTNAALETAVVQAVHGLSDSELATAQSDARAAAATLKQIK